jgi:hypothetical protein
MYCEDFFVLDTSGKDESSVDFKIRQEKTADSIKRLDRYYEKYSIPFNGTWTDGKYYKRITIENYGSRLSRTFARNAVTGVRYNICVGSADEDILFKVCEATGRNGRKDPLMLYYDSPEQYENHQFTSVSSDIKQMWNKRYLAAQKRLNM